MKELLRSLPLGHALWLRAQGESLWPLLLSGDLLRVVRSDETMLERGDIAVVESEQGILVAHLVSHTNPFQTCTSMGRIDAPCRQVLGRVGAIRRGSLRVAIPRQARWLLRLIPGAAGFMAAVPGARRLVRRWRSLGSE